MKNLIRKLLNLLGYQIEKLPQHQKLNSYFAKYSSYTMIPQQVYVENLNLAQQIISDIPGDIVECGVWRGGMIAGIANLFGNDRHYHLFDSFEGLPSAKKIDGDSALAWQQNTSGPTYFNNCTAEISFAKNVMEIAKVNSYTLHQGWFNETLPKFKTPTSIALLRLDGDWYDSTMDCLKHLYPLVVKGGLVLIDDYYTWEGCSRAVHDYLSSIQSQSRIQTSKYGTCYIIKKDDRA